MIFSAFIPILTLSMGQVLVNTYNLAFQVFPGVLCMFLWAIGSQQMVFMNNTKSKQEF